MLRRASWFENKVRKDQWGGGVAAAAHYETIAKRVMWEIDELMEKHAEILDENVLIAFAGYDCEDECGDVNVTGDEGEGWG